MVKNGRLMLTLVDFLDRIYAERYERTPAKRVQELHQILGELNGRYNRAKHP